MSDFIREIAIIVPTFRRPLVAQRAVDSIRRMYPDARVYVMDDSPEPRTSYPGAWTIPAPGVDIGLSAKRNALVGATDEPYVLCWDDDVVCTPSTRIGVFYALLRRLETIGIVGAAYHHDVFPESGRRTRRWFTGKLWPDGPYIRHVPPDGPPQSFRLDVPEGDAPERVRYHVVDFCPNWFLARRETLLANPWDPELALREHEEHFARLGALRARIANEEPGAVGARHVTTRDFDWLDRYRRRSRGVDGPMIDDDGNRVVYLEANFRSNRLPGGKGERGTFVAVPSDYAEHLVSKGWALDVVPTNVPGVGDVRPLSVPDPVEPIDAGASYTGPASGVPLGVVITPDVTAAHIRTQSAEYHAARMANKWAVMKRAKTGVEDHDRHQWTEYPHPELNWKSVATRRMKRRRREGPVPALDGPDLFDAPALVTAPYHALDDDREGAQSHIESTESAV
jgi:hypothetical protein